MDALTFWFILSLAAFFQTVRLGIRWGFFAKVALLAEMKWCRREVRYAVISLFLIWSFATGAILYLDNLEENVARTMGSLLNQKLSVSAANVFDHYQKSFAYAIQNKLDRVGPDVLVFAGEANYLSGHYDAANRDYDLAEKKIKDAAYKSGLLYNAANVLIPLTHRRDSAIKVLEEAIDLNHDNTFAKEKLQKLLMQDEADSSSKNGQPGGNQQSQQKPDPSLRNTGNGGAPSAPPDIQK